MAAYLPDVAKEVVAEPCHVILDVAEGGESYSVSCVSAATETPRLRGRYEFMTQQR